MFLPYMSADIVRWIHAKPDATKRGRPNTEKQRSLRAAWQSETEQQTQPTPRAHLKNSLS